MSTPLLIRVTGLWERTSASGYSYLTGRLGGAKLLIFVNRDRKSESDPSHLVFITEPPRADDDR